MELGNWSQGKASQVKRDMTTNEHRKCIEILEEDCNDWTNVKWATALRMQFGFVARGDDVHKAQNNNFSQHSQFNFALQTKLNWSKNVRDERQCPFQIILGSMSTTFCLLLSLATCLEVRFATFGTDSKWLFAEDYSHDPDHDEEDDHAPIHSLASYSKQATDRVFQNPVFVALSRLTAGSLGMHSLRKCTASFAKRMGCSQDDIDIRGRWKGNSGGRTSTRCINPEQPHIDAKVCGHLCMEGPIKHCFKPGAEAGPAFFAEHVCPNINKFFPASSKMAETLGPALLWACFEPSVARTRIPDWLVKKVKEAYEDCRPEQFPEGANPIQRVPLVVCKVGEHLCIEELPRDGAAPVGQHPQQQQPQRSNVTHVADHVTAQLHAVKIKMASLEAKIDASYGDMKQELMAQLSVINKNITRLQLMAPRQAPAAARTMVGPRTTTAQLAKTKCLHTLWVECTHGIGGNKAAKVSFCLICFAAIN